MHMCNSFSICMQEFQLVVGKVIGLVVIIVTFYIYFEKYQFEMFNTL